MNVTADPVDLEEALLGRLSHLAGQAVRYRARPTRLTGGFWAVLISFELEDAPPGWDGRLVARLMPDAAIAARETAFQDEVSRAGYPTPKVRAAGGPAAGVDGRAFLVMDHVSGRPLLAGLDGAGAIARLPSLARLLPEALGRAMADLHSLNPAPMFARLTEDGTPPEGVAAYLDRMRAMSEVVGRTDLVTAADRLAATAPAPGRMVLCHGDLHPFNLLIDDAGTVTVIDWSAAILAPAEYDLAFTSLLLSEPPLDVPRPLGPVVRGAGRALARRFLARYRDHGGSIDGAALAWHQGLICLRALTEVAGWVAADEIDDRAGHPWVIGGVPFADRLGDLTGTTVRTR
jgi:aminoglycoside phosphotransferase (APT) family kinase protein